MSNFKWYTIICFLKEMRKTNLQIMNIFHHNKRLQFLLNSFLCTQNISFIDSQCFFVWHTLIITREYNVCWHLLVIWLNNSGKRNFDKSFKHESELFFKENLFGKPQSRVFLINSCFWSLLMKYKRKPSCILNILIYNLPDSLYCLGARSPESPSALT